MQYRKRFGCFKETGSGSGYEALTYSKRRSGFKQTACGHFSHSRAHLKMFSVLNCSEVDLQF